MGADAVMDLLSQARNVGVERKAEIDAARVAAVIAIRKLEAVVVETLAGTRLLGFRNLGDSVTPIHAARVRGSTDTKLAWPRPGEHAQVLVVDDEGRLSTVHCTMDRRPTVPPATSMTPAMDGDLMAEDIEGYVRTLAIILPRHIASATESRERFTRIRKLSDRVLRVLTEEV